MLPSHRERQRLQEKASLVALAQILHELQSFKVTTFDLGSPAKIAQITNIPRLYLCSWYIFMRTNICFDGNGSISLQYDNVLVP